MRMLQPYHLPDVFVSAKMIFMSKTRILDLKALMFGTEITDYVTIHQDFPNQCQSISFGILYQLLFNFPEKRHV